MSPILVTDDVIEEDRVVLVLGVVHRTELERRLRNRRRPYRM
jgi:hypothetical protein